ncbi:MAG: glycosyltransferase family 1 protein [Patescibacteria group bacterium]
MKIGIQGWFLPQPMTGIGQHSRGLLTALLKNKKAEITVVVPESVKIPGLKASQIKVVRPKFWIPHPALRRWVWERVQVPAAFAEMDLDWQWYPYPCPLPLYSPHLRAVTVHDLILWHDPRYQGHFLKRFYYDEARRSLIRADQIFTVSESIHHELGIPTATVLPNAIPEIPRPLPRSQYPGALVYLGGFDIRKNVPLLVKTFQKFHKRHPDIHLILIGKAHSNSGLYPDVPDLPGLIKIGSVPDKNVYALLKESFAFVHFSDAEGFNIPLLQAMSVGAPAVVLNLPVNREVSGGHAFFVPPSHPEQLLDKLELLFNEKERKSHAEKLKQRAKDFSWDKSAKIFLKALK